MYSRSYALALFAASAVITGLATTKVSIPLEVSALLMLISVMAGLIACLRKRIGPITVFAHLVLCAPFVHLIPYLFGPPPPDTPLLWGLVPNPAMFDLATIGLTATLGAIGSAAFASGFIFSSGHQTFAHPKRQAFGSEPTSAPLWTTVVLLAVALAVATISAPKKTIFEAIYTGEGSIADSINFNSAWLVAVTLLLLTLADAIADQARTRSRLKAVFMLASALYFVVWLQFARGDREALFFVFACGYLIWVWGAPQFAKSIGALRAIRAAAVVGIIVTLAAGVLIQKYRTELAPNAASLAKPPADAMPSGPATPGRPAPKGESFKSIDIRIPNGTWSAVLLTPLSVADAERKGQLGREWGRTYLDLLLSLPPGFLADRIGYKRPIDATRGPAHQQKYGLGGTHAVVVPMMNFGFAGILVILALIGWLIGTTDRISAGTPSGKWATASLIAQGMLITILPHWLWYGDKILLTATIISTMLVFLHLAVVKIFSGAKVSSLPQTRTS